MRDQATHEEGLAARMLQDPPFGYICAMIPEVSARTYQHRITCSVCANQHVLAAQLQDHYAKYSMAREGLKRHGLSSGIVVLVYTSYFNSPSSFSHIKTRQSRYYDCQLSGSTMDQLTGYSSVRPGYRFHSLAGCGVPLEALSSPTTRHPGPEIGRLH